MKRNLLIATVVGIALVSTAGIASAQAWYNVPVGLSATVTSEAAAAPWTVDVDVTVQTIINAYTGSGSTYTSLSSARIGSQFFTNYGIARFYELTQTTIAGFPVGFPGNRPAVNWGGGAMVATDAVPLIGDGTGAFGGSYSHTYNDNYAKSIVVGASNLGMYLARDYFPVPLTGEFTDTLGNTTVWATQNSTGVNAWNFASAPWTEQPMGIRNTTVAWADNVRDVVPIPTMSGLGMLVLAGLLAGLGVFVLIRR